MESVIQPELFDPLIKYIQCIKPASNYIEFTLPHNLSIDNEQVLQYFNLDVVLSFERGKLGVLKGTIKSNTLFVYLATRSAELH